LNRLDECRRKISDIDEKIIKLIDQRMEISGKIFEAKRSEGRQISDPDREKQVLRMAADLAREHDLDENAIREIFVILIRMSLEKQHRLQQNGLQSHADQRK
jgi:chorismate mutase